jgi:hypothetical protein
MEAALRLVAAVSIASSAPGVLAARARLRNTTLRGAWWWGAIALSLWALSFFATEVFGWLREGEADQVWLASAVLLVCPFVAVLGARRPGSRVWDVFIVAPLAIVLDLPAVTAWNRDLQPAALHLEVPMLAGYALVLVMGAGNYLATRFALPALLAAAAMLLVPVSMSSLHGAPDPSLARPLATLLLSAAVWGAVLGLRKTRRTVRPAGPTPLEELWNDFRDLYGIVWARRVLDRVNAAAVQEGWPVRLQLTGFFAIDSSRALPLTPEQSGQIEHTLRWLLRRFVDPEWIDERIAVQSVERSAGSISPPLSVREQTS